MTRTSLSAKDLLMRYSPVAIALSLAVAVTSSALHSTTPEVLDSRAEVLLAQGREALSGGLNEAAIDAFESALTIQPGNAQILIDLAVANRRLGMQGKAIHYYRQALVTEPRNLAAIAGEGAAMAEKGATEKANRNLARLKAICGSDCDEVQQLAAVIAHGPAPKVVSAQAMIPNPTVTEQ